MSHNSTGLLNALVISTGVCVCVCGSKAFFSGFPKSPLIFFLSFLFFLFSFFLAVQ